MVRGFEDGTCTSFWCWLQVIPLETLSHLPQSVGLCWHVNEKGKVPSDQKRLDALFIAYNPDGLGRWWCEVLGLLGAQLPLV